MLIHYQLPLTSEAKEFADDNKITLSIYVPVLEKAPIYLWVLFSLYRHNQVVSCLHTGLERALHPSMDG